MFELFFLYVENSGAKLNVRETFDDDDGVTQDEDN